MNFARRVTRNAGNKQPVGLRPNPSRRDVRDWECMYLPYATILDYSIIFPPNYSAAS